jgi:hypothetical protein
MHSHTHTPSQVTTAHNLTRARAHTHHIPTTQNNRKKGLAFPLPIDLPSFDMLINCMEILRWPSLLSSHPCIASDHVEEFTG